MMFTYCLVTKGRRDYLPSTLETLSAALHYDDVNVIVIDNGCASDITEFLKQWCLKNDEKAKYLRFDVNETSATRVWDTLRGFDIDWISFPGDDDLIHPEFLEILRLELERRPNLAVVAASMEVINSSGTRTGEIRKPKVFSGSIPTYLAKSIHEPPFLFPALFFKFSLVKGDIPSSRYVFDWWLALNLVALGNILISSEVAIEYRVHSGQESALAPKRRKFFEAQVVISRLIQSSVFQDFISGCSKEEVREFWLEIRRDRPIYQDQEFGNYLFTLIGLKLVDSIEDVALSCEILNELAIENGVLLRHGEVRSVSNRKISDGNGMDSNFKLEQFGKGCPKLASLISQFNSNSTHTSKFFVGCVHSHKKVDFLINCEEDLGSVFWIDELIVNITDHLESQGKLSFTLSPAERKLISVARRWKGKVPNTIRIELKKTLRRLGGSQ